MQKKKFKGLFIVAMLTALLSSCGDYNANANKVKEVNTKVGGGAGGIIKIINNSDYDVHATWSGTGCTKVAEGLSLVCATGTIASGNESTYGYNWGVSTTWLNIGNELGTDGTHPCSPLASEFLAKGCIFDHRDVDTKADDVSTCTISGMIARRNYEMSCRID